MKNLSVFIFISLCTLFLSSRAMEEENDCPHFYYNLPKGKQIEVIDFLLDHDTCSEDLVKNLKYEVALKKQSETEIRKFLKYWFNAKKNVQSFGINNPKFEIYTDTLLDRALKATRFDDLNTVKKILTQEKLIKGLVNADIEKFLYAASNHYGKSDLNFRVLDYLMPYLKTENKAYLLNLMMRPTLTTPKDTVMNKLFEYDSRNDQLGKLFTFVDKNNETALYQAIKYEQDWKFIKFFLVRGAKLNVGKSPLGLVIKFYRQCTDNTICNQKQNYLKIIQIFLDELEKKNAPFDADDYKTELFKIGIQSGNIKILGFVNYYFNEIFQHKVETEYLKDIIKICQQNRMELIEFLLKNIIKYDFVNKLQDKSELFKFGMEIGNVEILQQLQPNIKEIIKANFLEKSLKEVINNYCKINQTEVIEFLLPYVYETKSEAEYLLKKAVDENNTNIFDFVFTHIQFWKQINDEEKVRALMISINQGNADFVENLIDFGADPYKIVDGIEGKTNALMCAVEKNNLQFAEMILENSNGNVSFSNEDGDNALTIAIRNKDIEMAKLLLKYDKLFDEQKIKNFIRTLYTDGFEEVSKIIMNSENFDAKATIPYDGNSFLSHARSCKKFDIVQRLEKL